MAAPQSRKPGSVKDMSKDRADSKKNVTQQKAKLAEDWARKTMLEFSKADDAFGRITPQLQKMKALADKPKDDDETRKKLNEQAEHFGETLGKIAKGLSKHEVTMKTVTEVRTIGPMPKVAPPTAMDIAALLAWAILWHAWVTSVRKTFK